MSLKDRKMKALLAYPPISLTRGWEGSLPFLENLVCLGSYLKHNGVDVVIFHQHPYSMTSFVEIIRQQKPAIICISVDSANFDSCFQMTALAKKISPDSLTILGGIHATVFDAKILEYVPSVDLIVRGEGEVTLQEILDIMETQQTPSFKNVLGITYRDGKKICKNAERPVIEDLDTLPFLSYDLLDMDKIEADSWPGCYAIHTGRGCSFPCHFCADKAIWNRYFRCKSPKKIIEEIKYCRDNYPIKGVFFGSDTFTTNKERTRELSELLIQENMDIDWCCSTRVDCVDEDLLALMKKSGCRMIAYGVESLSDDVLQAMKKNYSAALAMDSLRKSHAVGIDTRFNLIFGYPGETERTLRETLSNLTQLHPEIMCKSAALYQLHPGSGFYNDAKEKGLIDDDMWFKGYKMDHFFDLYHPPEFAKKASACRDAVLRRYEESMTARYPLTRRLPRGVEVKC
jgi:anaerobic magnesium-protoporphyrin IX monomethyl ester cyclase